MTVNGVQTTLLLYRTKKEKKIFYKISLFYVPQKKEVNYDKIFI